MLISRAHPRSRGENGTGATVGRGAQGSSPLTRGKRATWESHHVTHRLIPAHAGKTQVLVSTGSAWRAHPRSRGENRAGLGAQGAARGSSPLTRGKQVEPRAKARDHGLIPAHAGKTYHQVRASRDGRAHPRSRGENSADPKNEAVAPGSSPLTRGKRVDRVRHVLVGGLIPAHAGKTRQPARSRSSPRAHPRSRGENVQNSAIPAPSEGSSPLTRGKQPAEELDGRVWGLIPAHAGKTCSWSCPRAASRAHPRSRGENATACPISVEKRGSSPLTRGKRGHDARHAQAPGLIPAHAGKTVTSFSPSVERMAHPRSRGENSVVVRVAHNAQGSSPLTRGKHAFAEQRPGGQGLIPAHAGKTSRRPGVATLAWAHPRSRGENHRLRQSVLLEAGSSPLTRGKHGSRRACPRGGRLIPAHAGKTHPTRHPRRTAWAHPRSRGENSLETRNRSPV